MDDPVMGALMSGSINLVHLVFISVGGSMPDGMALASVPGTAYAITGDLDATTALASVFPLACWVPSSGICA